MALVTPDSLKTMDWAFHGQPFVNVPVKAAIDVKTMDYAFQGQPFVVNYGVSFNIGSPWNYYAQQ